MVAAFELKEGESPMIKTLLAGLLLGNVLYLILLARDYQADPQRATLLVGAFMVAAICFGLWCLLEAIWTDSDSPH